MAIFDLGKTNAKLALVDTALATELDVLSIPTPMSDGPLYRQPDVRALWEFLIAGISSLRCRGDIDALGVTTHGATVALLDKRGELALPVLDYEHEGPNELSDEYDAVRPPFSETGSPRLPGGLNVGAQLFWQQRRFPDRFAQVANIVTWPQYWAYRLSRKLASDATSLGCHTDLFVPATGRFSSLAKAQGWDLLLPPVLQSGDHLGFVSAEVTARTGLSSNTPVHVGIHDSNASLVPHLLAHDTPRAVISTGTWVIVMALDGEPSALDPARDTLINVNAHGQPVASARFMGGREYELVSRPSVAGSPTPSAVRYNTDQSTDDDDERALTRVLDQQAFLLPSVVRGSGPFPSHKSRWTIAEATLDDDMHAIVIAHYLALMTLTCVRLVGARGPIAVEGPFAGNRHYLRMLGAASGRSVEISVNSTGTSVGTAMLIDAPGATPTSVSDELSPEWQNRLNDHAVKWQKHAMQ